MICIARCKERTCVRIPDGISCKVGDVISCPKSCAYKNSLCAKRETFSVIAVINHDESGPNKIRYSIYSHDEIESIWGGDTIDSNKSTSDTPVITQESIVQTSMAPQFETDGSAESTKNKYQNMFGGVGSNIRPRTGIDSQDGNSTATIKSILKPSQTYNKFIVGGKVFSDDAEVKRNQNTLPLKNALREIFNYWITSSVFASETELKDEFIWLITTASKREILNSDVDAIILNEEYTISQKFFYLFYNVVFRYEPPKGFYWCEQRVSLYPLSSIFKDKQDFIVRYCEIKQRGEQFRAFFWQHKKEILHFLGCESEDKLFEDMTLILSKEKKQIVLIDKYNQYFPVYLGSISEFMQNMIIPVELSKMQNMVYFLEKYYVSRLGVSRRGLATPFEKSSVSKNGGNEKLEEDSNMYQAAKLLSSSNYATEYDCYMTLVREYVKVHSPNEITIGELHFTKNNYSAEIQNIIFDFCKARFGQVDDTVAIKLQARAWLAKSIYERNILVNFTCENNSQIEEYLSLISPANFSLKNYYKAFSTPVFTFGKTDLTMHDYIEQIIESEDVYTACSKLANDDKVKDYFSVKIKKDFETILAKDIQAYQEQYDGFISE